MNARTFHLLEQFESLSNKVVLYLPDNNPDAILDYAEKLSAIAGGCTVTPDNRGLWIDTEENLIGDSITLFTVFCVDKSIAPIVHLAHEVQQSYNQDCVSLEVNGKLYFIS